MSAGNVNYYVTIYASLFNHKHAREVVVRHGECGTPSLPSLLPERTNDRNLSVAIIFSQRDTKECYQLLLITSASLKCRGHVPSYSGLLAFSLGEKKKHSKVVYIFFKNLLALAVMAS